MAEHSRNSGSHLDIVRIGELPGSGHCQDPFAYIQEKHQDTPPEPHRVKGIHGAHVPAAHSPDVHAFTHAGDDEARRVRAYQVGQQQGNYDQYSFTHLVYSLTYMITN